MHTSIPEVSEIYFISSEKLHTHLQHHYEQWICNVNIMMYKVALFLHLISTTCQAHKHNGICWWFLTIRCRLLFSGRELFHTISTVSNFKKPSSFCPLNAVDSSDLWNKIKSQPVGYSIKLNWSKSKTVPVVGKMFPLDYSYRIYVFIILILV